MRCVLDSPPASRQFPGSGGTIEKSIRSQSKVTVREGRMPRKRRADLDELCRTTLTPPVPDSSFALRQGRSVRVIPVVAGPILEE